MDDAAILEQVYATLSAESAALALVQRSIEAQRSNIIALCRLMVQRSGAQRAGKIVLIGVGKTGLIARKIAATLSSTGTPAIFLHPTEALHGDLGIVSNDDIALFITHSGASNELLALVPALRRIGCTCACLVGPHDAPLTSLCDLSLAIGHISEACPLGLAPSASTTALLALGDAVAMAVQRLREFTPEEYARFHPGGALGRSLMTNVEAMRGLERTATTSGSTSLAECLQLITRMRSGSVVLVDGERKLVGIFTDGDLRRALLKSLDPAATLRAAVLPLATVPCRSVRGNALVAESIRLCASLHINEIPVIDDAHVVIGMIDVQDLAQRGFAV